jgi:hypothetical protein
VLVVANDAETCLQVTHITIKVAEYPEMKSVFFLNQSYPSLWTAQFAPGPGRASIPSLLAINPNPADGFLAVPTVDAGYSGEIKFCPD